MEYSSDDLIPISAIQHFVFCRKQWALIYVEDQWQENWLTLEGKEMHKRVDDPFFHEQRKGIIYTRSVPVSSYSLGLTGVCDLIEYHPIECGVVLPGKDGSYQPVIVEYKHGEPKMSKCDEVQLCAQSMCLEEMSSIPIPYGYFYYGEIHRRHKLTFSSELQAYVRSICKEMHNYLSRGYTPRVKKRKACLSCSLVDLCLPETYAENDAVEKYIAQHIGEP